MKWLWGRKWRSWGIIALMSTVAFSVWLWVDYMPTAAERAALQARLDGLRVKKATLDKHMAKLQAELAAGGLVEQDVARIEHILVGARSLEEAGSKVQQMVQEVCEKSGVTVQSYRLLEPSSWEGIPMALVEFRLNAASQGLAAMLRFLEAEEKLVRVEVLSVVYRAGQGAPLFVTLRVGTLFVDVETLKKYVATQG